MIISNVESSVDEAKRSTIAIPGMGTPLTSLSAGPR